MTDAPNIIDVVTAEEDAEYQALCAQLEALAPPVSGASFDLQSLRGNAEQRTAKAIILDRSCKGVSVADLAELLHCNPALVSRYLMEAIQEASPIDDIEILRKWELAKIDAEIKWLKEQQERSCQDKETTTVTKTKDGTFTTTRTEGQAGNPAYSKVLMDLGKRRAALLGLDKPAKVSVEKTERKLIINVVEVKSRADVEAAEAAGLLESPK